ncbi:hypothetical protein [Hymenobacter cheonanensis]|uniref:hypothetical protein n=1 Tax=Hymenobacter sp. CA2-7 TaxID=3063993 RepID=UPI0027135129|nr:hypothetical protein [Hymenobacter sp. CA2-7]MDO7886841.1 hypothetical protein [Hymenobacter sp. CA2-7]
MKRSPIQQQAEGLAYPEFAAWLAKQPLARQYQFQREAGFPVLDGTAAQQARAGQLGLKPDAAPALILYLHHRGRAWIGKPSIRLEFATNEAALQTAARFADAGAPVVKSGSRGAARREIEQQLQELADQSKAEAAAPPAKPAKGAAASAPDAEFHAVKLLLSNGQPITAQQATRYPDLVKQYSEFYDSLGLPMISDAASRPAPAAALPADGSVVLVPVKDIKTDKKLFQNREADFSEESVQRILAAVAAGTFRWEVLDPVVLWRKPGTTDVYSLSGHSRKEAFRRLASQGTRVDGRGFEAIPAKITECSQAEAVEIARNSNNLSTKETELERAAYYRGLRAEGKSKKEIDAAAAGYEGKNKTFILNLSYLAPNGQAVQALASFADAADGSGKEVVRTLADWTGEARRRYPQLTDSHENETFDWLRTAYGSKAGQLRNKQEFLQRLDTTISRATTFGQFAADEPLNLANRTGKSSVEQEYDERLATAQRAHRDAEKALVDKRRELVARQATEKDLARILPAYEIAVTRALQELNKISAQRYEVKDAAKNQASLFGVGLSKGVRDLLQRAEALSNAEKRQAAQQLFLSAVD